MSDTKLELYKELGTYERHFNTVQGSCRTIASTWLLAAIGGLGYVMTTATFHSDVIDFRLAGSLIASAGAIGIALLWLLDVKVYHQLLVAAFHGASRLENDLDLTVRADMARDAGSVRTSISMFYGIPMLGLSLVAAAGAWTGSTSYNLAFCFFMALPVVLFPVSIYVLLTRAPTMTDQPSAGRTVVKDLTQEGKRVAVAPEPKVDEIASDPPA